MKNEDYTNYIKFIVGVQLIAETAEHLKSNGLVKRELKNRVTNLASSCEYIESKFWKNLTPEAEQHFQNIIKQIEVQI